MYTGAVRQGGSHFGGLYEASQVFSSSAPRPGGRRRGQRGGEHLEGRRRADQNGGGQRCFPALDMILVIAFFGKVGLAYFDYKKHGQFEWAGPVILFACLVLTLTAPLYIWTIIGI